MKLKYYSIFLLLAGVVLATSCVPRKKIAYFQNIENLTSNKDNKKSITLKPDDLLSIIVSSDNLESVQPFNVMSLARPVAGSAMGGSNTQEVRYLVGSYGKIHFRVLGTIQAGGLTPKELCETLTEQLKEYIRDPIV